MIPKGSPCNDTLIKECVSGRMPWTVYFNLCADAMPASKNVSDVSNCKGMAGCLSWGPVGSSAGLGKTSKCKFTAGVSGGVDMACGGRNTFTLNQTTITRTLIAHLICNPQAAEPVPTLVSETLVAKFDQYVFEWHHQGFCEQGKRRN